MDKYDTSPELNEKYVNSVWNKLPKYIRPTFLLPNKYFSDKFNCELTLAVETFQYTGSFKFRPAYNLISSISESNVFAASSGNFGQAVAYACKLLDKKCTIVMPNISAKVKIDAVRSYDATVDLIDTQKISREKRIKQLLNKQQNAFVAKGYDDYRVVTGNSTLGKEILSYMDFDSIIVPIGGGGLSSGIIIARDYLKKKTQIIGTEPIPGNDAAISLRLGKLTPNIQVPDTIADGARTNLGILNWEIIKKGIDDIIEVPDNKTLEALRLYFRFVNLKVEPTGALSLGALLVNSKKFKGKRVCCIVSGGNVDPSVYTQALLGK